MAIYSEYSPYKWWFYIITETFTRWYSGCNLQPVPRGQPVPNRQNPKQRSLIFLGLVIPQHEEGGTP